MANAAAFIDEGLWRRDREFQKLPRSAQCTFCQVLAQKDLDTCGVLTLNFKVLLKGCDELTADQLRADLKALEDAEFLFVDYDTDEILIRSYVRRVSGRGTRNNAWHSVPKNARLLGSVKLRRELAKELRRIGRSDANAVADEIDPQLNPPEPTGNPLSTPFEGGTPLGPPSDPHSQVLVLVPVSPSVGGSVGVQRARPDCPKHETDADEDCRACMRRRLWDEQNATAVAADDLDRKRAARAAAVQAQRDCHLCDDEGWVLGPDGTPLDAGVKCTAHERKGAAHA